MKIYFAGSIRGGRDDKELYGKLIQHLGKYGQVLTEHVGDGNLNDSGEDHQPDQWIYKRDMEWVRASDVIVAEVTTPSLGVGYEIGSSEAIGKKILCLYRSQPNKSLSAMINGNPNVQVISYANLEEAIHHIDKFFQSQS